MPTEGDEPPMNVSFSGCGFLGIYHVGVASAIREYAPELFSHKVTGASAGAIAACGLICDMCLGQATSDVLKIVIQARQSYLGPMTPSFNLMNILKAGLMKTLPDNAHKLANGRLFVSMTRFSDTQNVLISEFDSKEELVQALLCSSYIPFYCSTVAPTYRGVRYFDGGFSDNLPILNENTITVSPFSGESDICPSDSDSQSFLSFDLTNMNIRFTSRNAYRFSVALFPPDPEVMSAMCRQGFQDALQYLMRHGFIVCTRCIEVRSVIQLDEKTTKEMEEAVDQLKRRKSSLKPQEATVGLNNVCTCVSNASPKLSQAFNYENIGPQKGAFKKVTFNDGNFQPQQQASASSSALNKLDQITLQQRHKDECKLKVRAPAGPPVRRVQSVKSFNKLIDLSETAVCESCKGIADAASKRGLPQIVKKTLADAEAVERTLLNNIMAWKPIRYIRLLTMPWFLSWDIFYSTCMKFFEWLPYWREDGMWFAGQASDVVSAYLFKESEQQKSNASSRLTCQMAITDLTYSSNDQQDLGLPQQQQTPLFSSKLAAPPGSSRRSSVFDAQSTSSVLSGQGNQGGQCKLTQMNFGFSVDLAASSDPVRQIANIVVKDDVKKRDLPSDAVTCAAEELEMEGLRKIASIGPTSPLPADQVSPISGADASVYQQQQESLGTYTALLNFTHKRDSLMSYYFMDKNKNLKVTKIFGVDPTNVENSPQSSSSCIPTLELRQNQQEQEISCENYVKDVKENYQPVSIDSNQLQQQTPVAPQQKADKMVAVVAPIMKECHQQKPNKPQGRVRALQPVVSLTIGDEADQSSSDNEQLSFVLPKRRSGRQK